MVLFHVHIYKVPEKAEIDIEAIDEVSARTEALSKAKMGTLDFKKNDEGNYQAMTFDV